MTWSPVSFGLCPVDKSEDATQFFIKLAHKVNLIIQSSWNTFIALHFKYLYRFELTNVFPSKTYAYMTDENKANLS
jgi:hypothetical protein